MHPKRINLTRKHTSSISPTPDAFLKHLRVNDTNKRGEIQLRLTYVFSKLPFLFLLSPIFRVKKEPSEV